MTLDQEMLAAFGVSEAIEAVVRFRETLRALSDEQASAGDLIEAIATLQLLVNFVNEAQQEIGVLELITKARIGELLIEQKRPRRRAGAAA